MHTHKRYFFQQHNDRLTNDETFIEAAKDVAQDNHLPQVEVYRQVGQHSAQEGHLAIVILTSASTFHRQRTHLQRDRADSMHYNNALLK